MAVSAFWLIDKMESWAPGSDAEDWDNVGLLIGDTQQTVERILVALDATHAVVREAVEGRYDWLITHHPLIFSPIKRITANDPVGEKIIRLIQHNIGLYSAHTNLDITNGGVNDILFEKLGLLDKQPLMEPLENGHALGRIGKLPQPMTLKDFISYMKETLCLTDVRYAGAPEAVIQTVGLCAGDAAGHHYWQAAVRKSCDVYITGDLRHHGTQDALEAGLSMVDITHYAGEAPVLDAIVSRLRTEAQKDGITLVIENSKCGGQIFKR